jgi:hypothetical protein
VVLGVLARICHSHHHQHYQRANVLTASHMPSLWITLKENGPKPTRRAQRRLVGANDCKCSRDQQLNVLSEARSSMAPWSVRSAYDRGS